MKDQSNADTSDVQDGIFISEKRIWIIIPILILIAFLSVLAYFNSRHHKENAEIERQEKLSVMRDLDFERVKNEVLIRAYAQVNSGKPPRIYPLTADEIKKQKLELNELHEFVNDTPIDHGVIRWVRMKYEGSEYSHPEYLGSTQVIQPNSRHLLTPPAGANAYELAITVLPQPR